MRQVARSFGVSLFTVQRWVARAEGQRLDRVDWSNHRPGRMRPSNRTSEALEQTIVETRSALASTSALGEFGAKAIQRALLDQGLTDPPSIRTIGRVLERWGILDARTRVRRLAPPPGWYLPEVVARRAELDSFDTVSGLVIRGGIEVEVLNGISLHGGLIACFPRHSITAAGVVQMLIEHWVQFGSPHYAQFDNATIFQGPHQHRDVVGRVIRTCLLLGVTPVFAPVREPGFQAAVESLNGRWQAKVWARFEHLSIDQLMERSTRYVAAAHARSALRIDAAPARIPLCPNPKLDLHQHPRGVIIFIRRTDSQGRLSLLGRTFPAHPAWLHRLVRAEVDLTAESLTIFALRRRQPAFQPLLNQLDYVLPRRRFKLRP